MRILFYAALSLSSYSRILFPHFRNKKRPDFSGLCLLSVCASEFFFECSVFSCSTAVAAVAVDFYSWFCCFEAIFFVEDFCVVGLQSYVYRENPVTGEADRMMGRSSVRVFVADQAISQHGGTKQ